MEFDASNVTNFIDHLAKLHKRAMRSAAQRCATAIRKETFKILRQRYSKIAKNTQKDNVPTFKDLTSESRRALYP